MPKQARRTDCLKLEDLQQELGPRVFRAVRASNRLLQLEDLVETVPLLADMEHSFPGAGRRLVHWVHEAVCHPEALSNMLPAPESNAPCTEYHHPVT